ncbi:MAG: large subunit ribosomal protein L29 [Candidatus Nitrosomirales archaeon]|jgi:large subunit ribosomal protein L29
MHRKKRRAKQMARMKLKDLRKMGDDELADKLSELKADLAKLKVQVAKGTLKKQAGKIRYDRRDVARVLTILNERGKKL